jgi:2-polyprenyl-3-methyl-5-hydroxy-6-metoxy-1,4-benzoquinol methylase
MLNTVDNNKICPSCGCEGNVIGLSFGEDVISCNTCSLCYLKKAVRPRTENDNNWYQEVRDLQPENVDHIVDQMKDAYIRQLNILENLTTDKKILDVGCGLGIFLAVAKSKDWNVYGLESSENARYFADKNFNIKYQLSFEEFSDNTFDVVRISHVLEHIPEPKEFLQHLYRVLKPSGILVIIVPNREPFCAMLVNRWRSLFNKKPKLAGAIYPDMHVLGFSVKSLGNLVNFIDFTEIETFTVSMGNKIYYPLFYDGLLNIKKIQNIKLKDFVKYYLPMIIDNIANPIGRGQWIVGYYKK